MNTTSVAMDNLCENCRNRPGSPAHFHYGTQDSTKQRVFIKEKTTIKSQAVGTSSAVICADCAAGFRWKSMRQNFFLILGAAIISGIFMLIPVLQIMAGCALVLLVFAGPFVLLRTLFAPLQNLAEELAVNIKKSEFERKGFNKLWTPDEFKSTFKQTSPIDGLWSPPTPFNPGNSLKLSVGIGIFGVLLFLVWIIGSSLIYSAGASQEDMRTAEELIYQQYGWLRYIVILSCIASPLAIVTGFTWFIGTYRSAKT